MFNAILLLAGDLFVCVLQSFYMGVGIRQSAGWQHSFGMIVPTLFFWLLLAWVTKLYHPIFFSSIRPEERVAPRFSAFLSYWIAAQRPFSLIFVWLTASVFAVFWQTWYWNAIIQLDRGISIRYTFYFCIAGAWFLMLWRVGWTTFIAVRFLALRNQFVRVVCYVLVGLVILYQIPAVILTVQYAPKKYSLENLSESQLRALDADTAVVFGAGVYRNGTPSSVLRDRILTAVDLYDKGLVSYLLMSGDNSAESQFEVDVMTREADAVGIPAAAILRDDDGLSTAETCFNAAATFGLKSAVLVSQNFHTTRAMYICQKMGVDTIAVSADRSVYNTFGWMVWNIRDWVGLPLTWAWVNFFSSSRLAAKI